MTARRLQFLRRFDVVTSQVAEDALLSLFATRAEIVESITFDSERLEGSGFAAS